MKKKKDLIIVLHYTTIATIKTTKKKQKTKNLSEDIYTFFPVSLSDIVCTPRHFFSHLCVITGLSLLFLIRPCCLIVYIFPFLQPFHEFFFCSNLPFHHVTLLSPNYFFSGINPSTLIRNNAKKQQHNYQFLTRRFFQVLYDYIAYPSISSWFYRWEKSIRIEIVYYLITTTLNVMRFKEKNLFS